MFLTGSSNYTTTMTLSLLSFPLPASALCTIFGERGLPCLVTSPSVSLSPCPVSSGFHMFVLSRGVRSGGGTCCYGEGVGGGGAVEVVAVAPCPLLPGSRGLLVGIGVPGVGGFGHLLLLAHICQSVVVKGRSAGSCLPSVFKGDFHSGLSPQTQETGVAQQINKQMSLSEYRFRAQEAPHQVCGRWNNHRPAPDVRQLGAHISQSVLIVVPCGLLT